MMVAAWSRPSTRSAESCYELGIGLKGQRLLESTTPEEFTVLHRVQAHIFECKKPRPTSA